MPRELQYTAEDREWMDRLESAFRKEAIEETLRASQNTQAFLERRVERLYCDLHRKSRQAKYQLWIIGILIVVALVGWLR